MKAYALTYWFTWAFLVLAAALTGVASLKDAFFGGLFASLFSALLLRPYLAAGVRFAPMVGAVAGACWVILMFFRIRWFGQPEDFERAQWTLGTDISVHAAGFAGAGLLTALRARHEFGRALAGGLALATAMTALPYGAIAWIDHRVAGPLEVVLLAGADVGPEAGPVRRPGAVQARFTPAEVAFLRERMLVVEGPGGLEVVDDEGRRYWPLWRRRLVYPGNPGGPVRTVLVLLPSGLLPTTWDVPLPQEPDGLGLAILSGQKDVRFSGGPVSQSVRLELSLALRPGDAGLSYQGLRAEVARRSPVGDLYATIRTEGLSAAFPTELTDAKPAAEARPATATAPERLRRPSFEPAPAAK